MQGKLVTKFNVNSIADQNMAESTVSDQGKDIVYVIQR